MWENLYENLRNDTEIRELIRRGNENLGVLGYTDHSEAHTALVAEKTAWILKEFGYDEHTQMLGKAAGFMHDIGNAINRSHHAEYGGILANEILRRYELSVEDRIEIVTCISNHDESTGGTVSAVSAALIIADKTDVRRNRVRLQDKAAFDIHDRVNYAAERSELKFSEDKSELILDLTIDLNISPVMEYFEIFLSRMDLCRRAAGYLGVTFGLIINGARIL